MTRLARHFIAVALLMVTGILLHNVAAVGPSGQAIQLTIEGVIGPATDDYVERSLQTAVEQQARLVVIRMDTPGGLDTAMRGIIKNISNSSILVASFVAPIGARAASAGTYILYASHIAAMAPGTNLGAATPVKIGGISPPGTKGKDTAEKKPEDNMSGDAMKRKIVNDASAYIRGLAQLRGRNADWAEKAVREAVSLPANEALKLKVIDIVASNMDDLIKQMHKREVSVLGQKQTLNTEGINITKHEPDWRSRFLSVITNPNIAYILMLIGIYGLIFEFSNPGAIIPGTVGAIALLLALYSFQMLPIDYAGMGLILLGVALMIGEAFQPSFGVLGIGGVISFVFGSIILMETDLPGFGINISVIVTFAVASVLIFVLVVGMAIKARRRPVVSGMEELVGAQAIVIDDFNDKGKVSIHGEIWNALSDIALNKGQQVRVTAVKDLTLRVESPDTPNEEPSH